MAGKSNAAYLCGGINKLSDSDCRDWREAAKDFLRPHECLDPMRRDYRGREATSVAEIVAGDIEDIRNCRFVLANVSRPSWGTAMEIRIAHDLNKPVLAFGAERDPSPWLVFHCKLFPSLQAAAFEIYDTLSSEREHAGR